MCQSSNNLYYTFLSILNFLSLPFKKSRKFRNKRLKSDVAHRKVK